MTGVDAKRIYADKGYRGHNHPLKFRVWISGQVRRTTVPIKREVKRRAAIEPVIGHLKAEHRMNRNHLKGREGDCINAVLAAAGYNFSLLIRWLAGLLCALIAALLPRQPITHSACKSMNPGFFTDDYQRHRAGCAPCHVTPLSGRT